MVAIFVADFVREVREGNLADGLGSYFLHPLHL